MIEWFKIIHSVQQKLKSQLMKKELNEEKKQECNVIDDVVCTENILEPEINDWIDNDDEDDDNEIEIDEENLFDNFNNFDCKNDSINKCLSVLRIKYLMIFYNENNIKKEEEEE
eukprot:490271_1